MANQDSGISVSMNATSDKTDAKNRKGLRHQYAKLIDETKMQEIDDNDGLNQSIIDGENMCQNVHEPREAICDLKLVTVQSGKIKQRVDHIHTNLTIFKPEDLAKKLYIIKDQKLIGTPKKMKPIDIWHILGNQAKSNVNISPPFRFLFGTFDPGTVQPIKRTRKPRNKDNLTNAAVQKPIAISVDESSKGPKPEVTRVLSVLKHLYRRVGPICFFEFVLNPDSFSKTVENIFYVSVLLKEGAAEVFLDGNNLPTIRPLEASDISSRKMSPANQSILSISKSEWKEMIDVFQIKRALIIDK